MSDNNLTHHRSRPAPYEDLRLLIGRMDGKLDIVLHRTHEHERRIAALEAAKHEAVGKGKIIAWIVMSAFAGGAGADQIVRLLMSIK